MKTLIVKLAPIAALVVLSYGAPALGETTDLPSPSPTPSMTTELSSPTPGPSDGPSASPSSSPASISNPFDLVGVVNSFLISVEDKVLSIWPSTPENFRLAHIVTGLHDSAPFAPWYLIAAAVQGAFWLLGALALVKAWKLVKW